MNLNFPILFPMSEEFSSLFLANVRVIITVSVSIRAQPAPLLRISSQAFDRPNFAITAVKRHY